MEGLKPAKEHSSGESSPIESSLAESSLIMPDSPATDQKTEKISDEIAMTEELEMPGANDTTQMLTEEEELEMPAANDATQILTEDVEMPVANDPPHILTEEKELEMPVANDVTQISTEKLEIPVVNDTAQILTEKEELEIPVANNATQILTHKLEMLVANDSPQILPEELEMPVANDTPQILTEELEVPVANDTTQIQSATTEELRMPVANDNTQIQTATAEELAMPVADDTTQIQTATEEPEIPAAYDITQIQMAVGNDHQTKTLESSETFKRMAAEKAIIDNSQPIDSVKDAVSKFGGIVDWKAHKVMAQEKHTHIQSQLEKALEDIPKYRKQSEATENAKQQVLEELDRLKKLIEELRDSLDKSHTEEAQAKQDSELAQLRVREMEQGISDDASTAVKAQLDVAKARHKSGTQDLKFVREELQGLRGDYNRLIDERDLAVTRAEEAVISAKEAEKKAEDLTLQLIAIKRALESAHASHLEAEERKIAMSMVRDQDKLVREKELNQAKGELNQLSEQHLLVGELKSKFEAASTTLLNLKTELAFYMEERLAQNAEITEEEDNETNHTQAASIHSKIRSAKKKLEGLKNSIEKTKDEVNCLREAASTLKVELDRETEAITTLRQKEGVASATVSSLEAELSRMQSELELVLTKEREAKQKIEDMPKMMQQATNDVQQAKSVAQLAQEELNVAKEGAEQAKAGASAMELRLLAVVKETEATKKSEALAVAAIKAMEESEKQKALEASIEKEGEADAPPASKGVTLLLEEYYTLSKNAHDAEEAAKEKVIAAVEEVKQAKSSEHKSLEKLEEAAKLLEGKKEELRLAAEMADKATDRKLGVEQELHDWKAENEQQRKAGEAHHKKNPSESASETHEDAAELNRASSGQAQMSTVSCPDLYADPNTVPESKSKKKKSFFPRIVMFLSRKKSSN